MPSNYAGRDVRMQKGTGQIVPVTNATVRVFNTVTQADLNVTLQTNASGFLPAGSLDVAAGTLLVFRVENFMGYTACAEVITT